MARLQHLALERALHYYHAITAISQAEKAYVSSAYLGECLQIDATQVRKDMAAFGIRGVPGLGFPVATTLDTLRHALGMDRLIPAILIGVGRLGGALAAFEGFHAYGLDFVALFDVSPSRQGQRIGTLPILPLSELAAAVRQKQVEVAVLAVPSECAQATADEAFNAGVRAVWSFSESVVKAPPGAFVRNEHIAIGFGELAYYLRQ